MSDFDWQSALGASKDENGESVYVRLRLELIDEQALFRALAEAEIDADADCGCVAAAECDCEDSALAESVRDLVAPPAASWLGEGREEDGVFEVVFELAVVDPFGRLSGFDRTDRDHWRARLCAYVLDYYLDRAEDFYTQRGLRLIGFDASESIGEISVFYV
jgi:hypothetical protein